MAVGAFSLNPVFAYRTLLFLQAAPENQHGNADINVPFYPDNNRYLAVHEYELGDTESLQTVWDFITSHTRSGTSILQMAAPKRLLHAIW
jgi:hypothetical protein